MATGSLEVAGARDAFLGFGTVIPTGSDLNTYTTPGVYRSLSANVSREISNCPYTNGGFRLEVIAVGSRNVSSYVSQIIRTANQNHVLFIRNLSAGEWGDWISFSDDRVVSVTPAVVTGLTICNTIDSSKIYVHKRNGVATISLQYVVSNSPSNSWVTVISDLPKPAASYVYSQIGSSGYVSSSNTALLARITSAGNLQMAKGTPGQTYYVTITYVTTE